MKIEIFNTPPASGLADMAMEFLVPIFGHGNYSFKKALSGWEGSGLQTLLAICSDKGWVKGIALALYDKNDPRIAVFGPIAVDKSLRNNGIGRDIALKVLSDLNEVGVKAVYLGVKEGHPARSLYRQLGFEEYNSGVVMRKMFMEANEFENDYYKASQEVQLRGASWADYSKFQALFSYPCMMKAFDWQSGYLSSKYVPQEKFLGVFPEMMEKYEKGVADIKFLVAGHKEAIVGISMTQMSDNPGLQGVNIDFFIHDNFLKFSDILLESAIEKGVFFGEPFFSKCLISDVVRKDILVNNNFCLNLESEMEIPGYGRELVQTYKYKGDKK